MTRLFLLATLAGCSHWVTTSEDVKPGECAALKKKGGGSCSTRAYDYAAGATVTLPLDDNSAPGARAIGRYQITEFGIDYQGLRRTTNPTDDNAYRSLAGHIALVLPFPIVDHYLVIGPTLGGDLGGIKAIAHEIRPRGDLWVGAFVEVALPDIGPLEYLDRGVPALRVGYRYEILAQEWRSSSVLDIGLVWRWGEPYEVHRYTYFRQSLD
ncbi:MAG TPA: hypothetical protein VGM90_06310 [Kofleriaceae bacterium]